MHVHRPFIPALTGIRFVAALMVVIGHGTGIMPSSMPEGTTAFFIAQITSVGMSLFFVLSGFVIWINYALTFHEERFPDAMREFAVARIARLYPMYFCVLLLAPAVSGMDHLFQHMPWPLLYFPMIQSWVPGGHGFMALFAVDWAGHLWSVSTESFFYMLFPIVALILYQFRSVSSVILAGATNVLAFAVVFYLAFRFGPAVLQRLDVGDYGLAWLTYYSPYLRLFEFFGGCLAASLFLKLSQFAPSSMEGQLAPMGAWAILLGFVSLPILLALIPSFPQSAIRLHFLVRAGSTVLFPLLLIHLSRYQTFLSRALSCKIMIHGGEASYSIYLLHPFFVDRFSFHVTDFVYPGEFFFRLIIYTSLVTIISWGTFMWIENPARAHLRKCLSRTSRSRSSLSAA